MTIAKWLGSATQKLQSVDITTARLDCLVLLEDCLNKNRTHLLAHPELELTNEQLNWLNPSVQRRSNHEPLAYIRGMSEFYGREFTIDKRVLEPRPESETMIDLLKSAALPRSLRVADVGAGSGALGITARLELPDALVDLLEVDQDALEVARINVNKFSIKIEYIKSDLLAQAEPPYDVILANLPYVPDNFRINPAAQAEPRLAIFGGIDGLDVYRRLFAQLADYTWKPQLIFTESLPPQHEQLANIAKDAGFALTKTEDFIQQFEAKG